ncbi:MAG: hypothetical protein WD271_03260 [Acidimicrobiia bacterium]
MAARDRAKFFVKRPAYADRLLCVALCQGAGTHFVECERGLPLTSGIKDFDVWSFFSAIPGERFPADRRTTHDDFGDSKFGRWLDEPSPYRHYSGRRVDFLLRALDAIRDDDPADALRAWLRTGRTRSAGLLAMKGVVLIDPPERRREIVWPI